MTALQSHMPLFQTTAPRLSYVQQQQRQKENIHSGPEPPESSEVCPRLRVQSTMGRPTAVSQARGLWSAVGPVHPRVILQNERRDVYLLRSDAGEKLL